MEVVFLRERQSNFELLRIIAMFCIVLGHSMTHGTLLSTNKDMLTINFFIFRFLGYSGKIGVYLFVLITGYFMIYSTISIKKVVKLWMPVFFWSILLTIFIGYTINQLSYKDVVMSFFPIIFNKYWFVSTYIFLYLLIPIINKSLLALSRKQEYLVFVLGILIIIPSNYLYGSNINSWLLSFCFTYSFGAIIRKREILQISNIKFIGSCFLVLGMIGNFINSTIITYGRNSELISNKLSIFLQKETLFCLFIALGLFLILGSKVIPYNRIINSVAATTFGIYLIHDNGKMEYFLWISFFKMDKVNYFPIKSLVYVILSVSIIFIVCSILELVRGNCFNKVENRVAEFIEKTKI